MALEVRHERGQVLGVGNQAEVVHVRAGQGFGARRAREQVDNEALVYAHGRKAHRPGPVVRLTLGGQAQHAAVEGERASTSATESTRWSTPQMIAIVHPERPPVRGPGTRHAGSADQPRRQDRFCARRLSTRWPFYAWYETWAVLIVIGLAEYPLAGGRG